eukprot:13181140-Ditylum_brightwellii.AAC.1
MEMADQDSHCTYRRSMTRYGRRLDSGRKGEPCDRAVIEATMSLQNKRGNVHQHKSQVDAKHDPFQKRIVSCFLLLE